MMGIGQCCTSTITVCLCGISSSYLRRKVQVYLYDNLRTECFKRWVCKELQFRRGLTYKYLC